jgi:hypothetical protein
MVRLILALVLSVAAAEKVWAFAQSENHNVPCCNKAGGGCTDSSGLPLPPCPSGNTADTQLVSSDFGSSQIREGGNGETAK